MMRSSPRCHMRQVSTFLLALLILPLIQATGYA